MNPMKLRIGAAAVIALIVMAWLAALTENWAEAFPLREQKDDYYNLLVDGFQAGHLHMQVAVDPGRLSPDVEVRKRAPYLLDASQYNSRYYLYFGVVPALLAFWPYAALTGHDLPPNLAVLFATGAAFLVLLRLYTEARGRYFPAARAWFDLVAAGLLALATGAPVLLVSGRMYEVALSWGSLWSALMLWGLFRALHAGRAPLAWLGMASLAFGLGVGCRPTIFLLGPLLPAVAWFAWRPGSAEGRGRNPLPLMAAIVVPAGMIGLGLMAYNYARFANPFEFGLNYQVNALAGNGHPLQSAAFIPANVCWYYFTPPTIGVFFPYFFPHSGYPAPVGYYLGSEPTHGQLPMMLLAASSLLAFVWLRPSASRPLRWMLALLAFAFLAMLLVTSTFAYRSSRYLIDFQPPLVLLILLLTGVTCTGNAGLDWRPRAWLGAFVLLGSGVCLFSLLTAFQFLDRFGGSHPKAWRTLAYYGNYPASWLARLGWQTYGPLHFKVSFTRHDTPVYEALVATGAPHYKDVLFVAQYPGGLVDFIVYHDGYGETRSRLIPIRYDQPYEIELDMGSLYPPAADGYFPQWPQTNNEILPTVARVEFDGTEIIRTRMPFYESSPNLLDFGRAPGRPERSFSGRITDIRRLPMRSATELQKLAEPGVWRIEFQLPPATTLEGQPLLSSGVTGRGNLLLLQNLPDGRFRFSMDFWGVGAADSPPLPRPAGDRHELEFFVGPQVKRHAALDGSTPAADVLRVWLDGQPVWTTPLIGNRDTYDFVGVGTNPQGFSSAQPAYGGWLQRVPLSPAEVRALVKKNCAPPPP